MAIVRRKLLGIVLIACITATAGYLALRSSRLTSNSHQEPGSEARGGGSGALSPAEMREQLSAEERKAVDVSPGAEVRELYTRGFWLRRHPTTDAAYIEALLPVLEKSPVKVPKGQKPDTTLEHPYNAGYAMAVLTRMWHVAGPIPYAADRLAAEAERLSACDDEVVQIEATMMLVVMHDKPAGSGLPPAAQHRLDQLLANEFIAQNVSIQRKVLAEAASAEAGK